jgi:hypothetical protein
MSEQDKIKDWLLKDSKYVKIKVGDVYQCIFQSMHFDETGGYQGKSTIKFMLKDLSDGKVREFSSSSKALVTKMQRVIPGDKIAISGELDEKERKTYSVVVLEKATIKADSVTDEDIPVIQTSTPNDETIDGEKRVNPKDIPF